MKQLLMSIALAIWSLPGRAEFTSAEQTALLTILTARGELAYALVTTSGAIQLNTVESLRLPLATTARQILTAMNDCHNALSHFLGANVTGPRAELVAAGL